MVTFLLLPIYLQVTNKDSLRRFNTGVQFCLYLLLLIPQLVLFTAVNIVMIPFAYLKSVIHQLLLVYRFY